MAEPERSNSSIGSEPDRSGLLERFSAGHGLRTSRSRRQSRQMKREQGVELDEWGMSSTDQMAKVDELKAALVKEGYTEDYDRHALLRFLRAREYSIPRALEMYTAHLQWRKDNKVDTILTDFDFTEREAFLGVYPQGYYKTDKLGRPVTIQHLGSIDLKKIKEVTTMDRMVRYHIQEYERFLKHIAPVCSRVAGRHIDQTFAILDVKGVGVRMLTGEVKKMLGEMTRIDGDHYPETLGKTCIINAPIAFKMVWSVVKTMLAARTVSKVSLVGTRYMEELLKYIDEENIPEYMGGKSKNALVDDVGPWNDPIILQGLNKIVEANNLDDPAPDVLELRHSPQISPAFSDARSPRGDSPTRGAPPHAALAAASQRAAGASPTKRGGGGPAAPPPPVVAVTVGAAVPLDGAPHAGHAGSRSAPARGTAAVAATALTAVALADPATPGGTGRSASAARPPVAARRPIGPHLDERQPWSPDEGGASGALALGRGSRAGGFAEAGGVSRAASNMSLARTGVALRERVDELQAELQDRYPAALPECSNGGGLKGRIETMEAALATLVAAQTVQLQEEQARQERAQGSGVPAPPPAKDHVKAGCCCIM